MDKQSWAWEPLSPEQVRELFRDLSVPWWIAGGWAIDLFVGRQTRAHEDTDVQIRRSDQLIVQECLRDRDWDLHKTNQPGLRPWPDGEYLTQESGVNHIWCRRTTESSWSVQLMLMETDGGDWVYRREPRIRGPLDSLGRKTADGLPCISPEIQLLYKAKRDTLEKDEHDFTVTIPMLDVEARQWLARALLIQFPEGHEWSRRIDKTLTGERP